MTKVAVVILNWNGVDYLERFLPSVTQNNGGEANEVWVVDNGSSDNSVAFVKEKYPEVKLLEFDDNYGFTGGYNKALMQIEAEYFVLLNSDIEVTGNWLQPMVAYLDDHKDVAACMPKILAYDRPKEFEYAGAAGGFIDRYGYPFCRGRIISSIEEDHGQYNNASEIFWATGAALFIRAELYKQFNGLDDDFFAHMEEIDLCWRLRNAGHKIMYIPQSVVYHIGGGTLPNNNPRKLFLNYRNNLYLLYKNLPVGHFRSILFVRMLLDGMSAIMYILQGKFSFFWAVPRAHFAFYTTLSRFREKRKAINASRKVSKHATILNGSLVYRFFVKGRRKFSDIKW
jgi:GT2 family glycosyltransferase